MSDNFTPSSGILYRADSVCRVAYTLNNYQPVRCTIIGDQPLFYIDYEDFREEPAFEDDVFYDFTDEALLEEDIEALRREIELMDDLSEKFKRKSLTSEQKYDAFSENLDGFGEKVKKEKSSTVDQLMVNLRKSRSAEAYLDFAKEYKIDIKLSPQVLHAQYDRDAELILINENLDAIDQILLASRELRRHWQHRQGALIHPLTFKPDNAVLVHRLQQADLACAVVRIAWELQLSGIKEAWERIENSPMDDLGRAFSREAYLDFRTLNSGLACAAALEAWFLSERCKHEDKRLIQNMLADYRGYVFDHEGELANITPSLISALGSMPFGKNYLAHHAHTIMSDPIFTDVRDRSNANFLWFIKFERSFRETEQELQHPETLGPESVLDSGEVFHNYSRRQDTDNEQSTTAQIVALYQDEANEENGDKPRRKGAILSPKSKKTQSHKKGHSNIVYLRHWPGS